jgi:NhaP-type Na+/H+ and K+/H+ antiporter
LLSTLGSVITSPLVSSATNFSFKMILSNSVLTSE